MSRAELATDDYPIPLMHPEDVLASHPSFQSVHRSEPGRVVPLRDFDHELLEHLKANSESDEDQLRVRFRNWAGNHNEVITITGTFFAIGVALGGLYAARKKRQN